MTTLMLRLLPLMSAACGLPRDAAGTVGRVGHGALRVGVVANPPFVIDANGMLSGVEPALVEAIARDVDARLVWSRGTEHALMQALRRRELDLVIAGLDATVPWANEVALTRPYYDDSKAHVLAAPPGENAWLVAIERVLEANRSRVGPLLARAGT